MQVQWREQQPRVCVVGIHTAAVGLNHEDEFSVKRTVAQEPIDEIRIDSNARTNHRSSNDSAPHSSTLLSQTTLPLAIPPHGRFAPITTLCWSHITRIDLTEYFHKSDTTTLARLRLTSQYACKM